jgi:hypothetical protein
LDSFDPKQRYLDAQQALSQARRDVDAASAVAEELARWSNASVQGSQARAELVVAVPAGSWSNAQEMADALVGLRGAQQEMEQAWDLVSQEGTAT